MQGVEISFQAQQTVSVESVNLGLLGEFYRIKIHLTHASSTT